MWDYKWVCKKLLCIILTMIYEWNGINLMN